MFNNKEGPPDLPEGLLCLDPARIPTSLQEPQALPEQQELWMLLPTALPELEPAVAGIRQKQIPR